MFDSIKNLIPDLKKEKPGVFTYLVNDLSTPHLSLPMTFPKMSNLKYKVDGQSNSPKNRKEARAANVYITLGNCINYVQSQSPQKIRNWASRRELSVVPVAGKQLNAYYDRNSLKFFFELDPVSMETVYTAESTDVVAHELGHALLDAMRPDFWSVQSLEIWSFHEAFADITSMVSIMQHDVVIKEALKETNGTLKTSNVISRLAEEVGKTVYNLTKGRQGHMPYALRDISIPFHYVHPGNLPKQAPDDSLAAECHSFGKVFASAWYQILIGFYENNLKDGMSQLEAVQVARDTAYNLLLRAVKLTPRTTNYFEATAKIMVALEADNPDSTSVVESVFSTFKLIQPSIKMLSNISWEDFRLNMNYDDEVYSKDDTIMVLSKSEEVIKLKDYIPEGMVSSLNVGDTDLAELEMEVASDSYYKFKNGQLVEETTVSKDEILEDVRLCSLFIQSSANFGSYSDTMWGSTSGRLVRTFID